MVLEKRADSLSGGSSHKSSSHKKGNVTSVTVRKNDPNEKIGIKLHQDATGRIRVKEIAKNGVFSDNEDIQVGDIVMSVNGKRLKPGEDVSVLHEVIKLAKVKITMVVKQDRPEGDGEAAAGDGASGEGGGAATDDDKSASSSKKRISEKKPVKKVDDNARRSRKSYQGKTKHNADGSIKLGVSTHDSNDVGEQVTISASKKISNQASLIEYVVIGGSLFVSAIDKDSIFFDTELEIGDRVLSVNDMNFRSYADAKYATKITEKAKALITIVVEKGGAVPAELKGKKKDVGGSKSSKSNKRRSSTEKGNTSDESSTQSCSTSFGGEDEEDCLAPLKKGGNNKELSELVVSVPKAHFYQEAGLMLEAKDGVLRVYKIADDSIFQGTSLEAGDRILAVNDVTSFRDNPNVELARRTMRTAKEAISLVIQKERTNWDSTNFDLDASSTNLVY